MIEIEVLQGDQMVMVVKVWEQLAKPEVFEYLERKGRFSLTLTFRVQLRAPNVVLVTASPHHPARCCVGQEGQVDSVFQEETTYRIVDLMLAEYKLDVSDRCEALDEIEAFLAEHMPASERPPSASF